VKGVNWVHLAPVRKTWVLLWKE